MIFTSDSYYSVLLLTDTNFALFPLSLPQKENIGDLFIVNAQLSQAGMYTCTAQTVVDSASASAKLVVRGKKHQIQKHEKKNLEGKDMNIKNQSYRKKEYKQKS